MRFISALAAVTLGAVAACTHPPEPGSGGRPLQTQCGQLHTIKVTVNAALKDSTIVPDAEPACAGDFVLWLIENRLDQPVTVQLQKFHDKGNPSNGKPMKWQGDDRRTIPSKFTAPALAQIPRDNTPRDTLVIVKYTVSIKTQSGSSHDIDPELQVDPPPDSMMGRLRLAPVIQVAVATLK